MKDIVTASDKESFSSSLLSKMRLSHLKEVIKDCLAISIKADLEFFKLLFDNFLSGKNQLLLGVDGTKLGYFLIAADMIYNSHDIKQDANDYQ